MGRHRHDVGIPVCFHGDNLSPVGESYRVGRYLARYDQGVYPHCPRVSVPRLSLALGYIQPRQWQICCQA